MEQIKDAISWFEIPVLDFARAKNFYQTILNIEMEEMEMGQLKMGMFPVDREAQGVGGAICFGEGYQPSATGARVYLNGGQDLNTVLHRVAGAGGSVMLPKVEIAPEMGHMAFFNDTEGNVVGLYSPQ